MASNFIDELVFKLKTAKNVKNTNWTPKLIFSMKKTKTERFLGFLTGSMLTKKPIKFC